MEILHFILNLILVISSLCVLTSENPVHSILFLILVFCNASAILFLFGLEFLALAFIMIYVGAIAVLFLFVVMMLNLKVFDNEGSLPYLIFVYFVAVLSWVALYLFAEFFFFGFKDPFYIGPLNSPQLGSTIHHYDVNLDSIRNIDALGQILYNYFTPCFLIAGLLLLVAMLSAIVLTLNFSSNRKNELCYRQLSRSNNFLSFLR